jgi:hypothetical protein
MAENSPATRSVAGLLTYLARRTMMLVSEGPQGFFN